MIEQVAIALRNKGIVLDQLDRAEDALAVFDLVCDRYGSNPNAGVRTQVAKALNNKGARLGALGRTENAIARELRITENLSKRR